MQEKLINSMRERVAETAAGTTALRNQGKGVIPKAKEFLKLLDPKKFADCKTEEQFKALLDKKTIALRETFPGKAKRNWGAARKVLNLYLRDMLYNRYLCSHFGFCHLEKWLEVPLDSWMAKGIHHDDASGTLPSWNDTGIKHLNPEVSDKYQKAAKHLAAKPNNRFPRIHLDIVYWRNIGRQIPN
jgi:hypothetical protein